MVSGPLSSLYSQLGYVALLFNRKNASSSGWIDGKISALEENTDTWVCNWAIGQETLMGVSYNSLQTYLS